MLRLRRFEQVDISLFKSWLYKEYIKIWYEEPEEWLKEVSSKEFSWVQHYIVEINGNAIGFCQYYEYVKGNETWHCNIDIEGTYSIDYLIGEENYLGKGIGKEMVKNLSELVFKETDAKRIIVQPENDNQASSNTLLSAGYKYDDNNKLYIRRKV